LVFGFSEEQMGSSRSGVAKRIIDAAGAFAGLLVLAVPMAGIWVLVRLTIGRPALFSQVRPGLNDCLFRIWKFKTMTDARDSTGVLLPDERRLTDLGRFLRASSLDELPELFNVLKGEMSLVGPRPLLVQYLERYTSEQARRHEVRPGITGWAQVNGRNALSWDEKLALDVWYVDNGTIGLDLKILWITLVKVLKREGISAEGHATMPPFMGTEETTES
jgi:sugar transferase EpsL